MESTVSALLAAGKGILAADESLPTIGKRLAALDIPSTEETRRAYRELLFTAPALNDYVSGAILFDETIRQMTGQGASMPEILAWQGVIPGIKVDKGTTAIPGFAGEKVTEGLDGAGKTGRIQGPRSEIHEVARGDPHWRTLPDDDMH
jgi:fructose-bisphosphate aldolase class I